MIAYLSTWLELKTDKRAVTAVEYAVLAAGLVVAIASVATGLGTALNAKLTAIVGGIS
jgi:pilus assembly protein Flp/PilA